ncbi:hypothetical protein E2562_017454 [Oryza meyeriana var. granulata]|uniref:Uncharacterized protein n=1 Tax=Oryza meyeriana var. granulata TaxID=110450 RepID=A0A6G1DXE6_9ORYZ|nr:hypothetical protein E2562_017454 [Oryza meyeriana var. granulata]
MVASGIHDGDGDGDGAALWRDGTRFGGLCSPAWHRVEHMVGDVAPPGEGDEHMAACGWASTRLAWVWVLDGNG